MNTRKYIIKKLVNLLPILSLTICISCTNSDSDERVDNNYNNPSIPVNVNIEGVVWENETPMSRGTIDEIKETVIPIDDDLKLVATLEPDYSVTEKTRGTTSLENGVAYRVIAYKQNGAGKSGDYVAHADFKVGTTPDIPFMLPWGCVYDIVCYSNGTGTLGTFDKETYKYAYETGAMPLYCKTTLTVPSAATTIPLNITLKHVDSMVKVIVKDATNNFFITGVSGVTAKAHYNAINVKLNNGYRSNPGGTSSSQSVAMKTPSSGTNNQCESDYVSIFSHDDALSTAPSINIGTIKLKNDAGKVYTISNKSLNGLSKWASGSRYKATFVLKTTYEYTITTFATESSSSSKYVNIKLTGISGGSTTTNPAQSVAFTGLLGSYATASYEYKTGESSSLNYLKHYLFNNWEINEGGGSWKSYSTESTILLEPSKEKDGYQYRANFIPDNRTIVYNWKVIGYNINRGTTETKYEDGGTFSQVAYQPLFNFCTVTNASSSTTGGWLLVIGSKTRTGWVMAYKRIYQAQTGWALGCNDDEFVPFDDLPGNDLNTRTHEIRIYVAWNSRTMREPKDDAEWENFDLWINNNK